MNDFVIAGIDCGEIDLKTAYVAEGAIHSLPLAARIREPLLYFDPHSSVSSLGVGFPAVVRRLGMNIALPALHQTMGDGTAYRVSRSTETPSSIMTTALSGVRASLLEATGKPPHAAALAVPSGMGQLERKTLLDCARSSGFAEVSLIDRSTAAGLALGYHRDKTTALVIDIGYSACEIALLRITRDKVKALASDVTTVISAELLDALLMEAIVLALRKQQIFLGLRQLTSTAWLEFRRLAETARYHLRTQTETQVSLIPELTNLDRPLILRIDGDGLTNRIRAMLGQVIESILGILEEHELALSDVDVLVAAGAVGSNSPATDLLAERFPVRRADAYLIAAGAALRGCQTLNGSLECSMADITEVPETYVVTPAPAVPKISRDGSEIARMVPDNAPSDSHQIRTDSTRTASGETVRLDLNAVSIGHARQLLAAGKKQEAVAIINVMQQEVQSLQEMLEQEEAMMLPRTLIRQAEAMLNTAAFFEAIQVAHRAYELAPADPEVFSRMMKIHADSGLAMTRPEEFDAAITVLSCAHRHDQTDRTIHRALAERHYMHAVAMRERNNISRAIDLADIALRFDPKHAGANALIEELSAIARGGPQKE